MIELFEEKHIKFKKCFGIALISIAAVFLIFIFWGLFLTPKVKATSPAANATNGSLKKIEVKFNKPVNRGKIAATLSPDVSGSWKYEDQIWGSHLFTKLVFYPDQYLSPSQSYSVKINDISSILHSTPGNVYIFDFTAQSLPKIKSASVENGQKDVRIDSPITIDLDQPNDGVVDYDFIFSPETSFEKSYSPETNQYTLKFSPALLQATGYSFTAKRVLVEADTTKNAEIKDDFSVTFTTKGPPQVKSFYPTGGNVLVDTGEIGIVFDQQLDSSELLKNVSINPLVLGKWSWDGSNNKLKFTLSEKLKYGTKYTIQIKKGVTGSGNYLAEDVNLTFSTIGNVSVISTSPKNNASSVTSGKIDVTFDQEVDHDSAQSAFYLEPATAGTFSWNGNTVSYTTSGFTNDSSYKFGVRSGIKSIHGLPSAKAFDYSFSTKSSETTLNVAQDYQDKPLSCEAASLKMALRYKGANVSENDIMNIVGFDPTIRNGNVWGDPYTAFVGDINGRQDTTGYGVYWDPIARAANTWRRATAFTGWSPSQAAEQIAAGNPIVVWGVTGGSIARDDWQTPGGKSILAWHGEHARTLIGFKGTVANPTSFILNDPVSGRITWTTSQFLSNWGSFGNAGVVVY